ncbi:MAG: hypothetical protein OHK0015_29590 [Chloroflexi bacterium OHK40]
MLPRIARIALAMGVLILVVGLRGRLPLSPAASAQPTLILPANRALVGAAGRVEPRAAGPGAELAVLLELERPPLAVAGPALNEGERRAYLEQLAAEQDELARQVEAMGGRVLARFTQASSGLAVAVDAASVAGLRALPGVRAMLPVSDYPADQTSSPAPGTLAELSALIGADEVRRRGNDGAGIEIAIVDSGLDYTHATLGGSGNPADYERAACGAVGLRPGQPGCNPPAIPPADLFPNAKVRGGYDYLGDLWPNPDPRCTSGGPCLQPDANPIDLHGHGTHVGAIAAGLPSAPGADDSGVAPGANLWAFKACNGATALCQGTALLLAIDHALDLDGSDRGACAPPTACRSYDPADIINLSLSYSYGQPEDALTLFANVAGYYGSLVVASAGNDGDKPYIVGSPATAAASLAVAESMFPTAPLSTTVVVSAEPAPATVELMARDASRGPRIADNAMKPDLAAPGALLAAQAGTGTGLSAFGGSSGAAPVVSGVAALIIQELEQFGVLDSAPGLADVPGFPLSLAPLVKAVLMNGARGDLGSPLGGLAPLTLQGAGRVNALASFTGRTLAWDASEPIRVLAADPELATCSYDPYRDLLNYLFFRIPPPCAAVYPFGDALYNAWNAQAGSVSFGYQPASSPQVLQRQVAILNYSRSPRSYTLGTSLRFADDEARGVALAVSPAALELAPQSAALVTLTLTIDPAGLRDWTLNGGELGNRGSATCPSPAPEFECPSLTLFEVDGALLIDGGLNNRVSLPVHVLPRKAAEVVVSRTLPDQVLLVSRAPVTAGTVESFALVDVSPNKCDTRDGRCSDVDYVPGSRPGYGQSPVDISEVGLRSYSVPGLNAALGLPPALDGALADEVVEFAITVFDKPYRASPNFPAQFEVHLDSDRDGTTDVVVYNADAGAGQDGRNAVFVRDVNSADGTRPTMTYFFTVADFNTQTWVLPVPAAAVGLRSDQPFNFFVLALDAYFRTSAGSEPWDCSPGPGAAGGCGASTHTMQTGALRFRPALATLTVPAAGRAALFFSEDAGGISGSPAQIGLLLLFPDALPGQGSASVRLR